MKSRKPILLIEDDHIDAMMVKRAIKEIKITNRLYIVGNGEEALAFLRNEYTEKPCLILLDLNMPRMNGIEFLRIAKKDDLIKCIPIIVLTTSKEEKDLKDSFSMSVAGYIIKPIDYTQFIEVINIINTYWTISEFPSH